MNGNYVAALLAQAGILVNCTKRNVIRLLPPLTVTREELHEFAVKLDEIFKNTNA